jgi:cytochrome P450
VYPDPEAFRPERFMERQPDAWVPFGGGVRRCLGASFATFEMGVVLRTVLAGARLRPASPEPEQISLHAVILVPRNGVKVVRDISESP